MWDVNGTLMNLASYIFRAVATYKQVYYKHITPIFGLQTYPYKFQLQPVLSTV